MSSVDRPLLEKTGQIKMDKLVTVIESKLTAWISIATIN